MRGFAVILFALSALVPVIQAYRDRDRIYQMPFLYSMAVFVYILPTLVATVGDTRILSDEQYIKYTLFSTLCFWSGLIGYWSFFNNVKLRPKRLPKYDPDKMSRFLYVIMAIAFASITVMGGFDVSERYGGAYAVLLFPARCLRPATIMLLILYLIKPSRDKLFFLILSLMFSLKIIIIDGRRSEVFNLFITLAFPLFFLRDIKVPRKFIVPSIVLAIIVLTFLPAYRNYTLKGNFNEVSKLSVKELIAAHIAGESTNEVVEAARNVDVADKAGKFNYGSTVYNVIVFQYAASTFFGKEFKESLLIPYNLDLIKLRGQNAKYEDDYYRNYLAPTGFAAVFFEFGYGGFLLFFLFGYLSKRFYSSAILKTDLSAVMFYCFFATFILFSIYDSMLFIPTTIILYLVVYWSARAYAKIPGKSVIVKQI